MSDKWRISISSPPDRNKLVAEIFFKGQQYAELNQEKEEMEIHIYSKRDGLHWELPYNDLIAVLVKAKEMLEKRNLLH